MAAIQATSETDTFTDPVCGMTVSADSEHHFKHEGIDYYFCCDGCRQKFSGDPAGYLSGEAQAAAAAAPCAPPNDSRASFNASTTRVTLSASKPTGTSRKDFLLFFV